jgi:thioredoxin 1
MAKLLQVTDENFHEALKAPSAVVEFWAEWCPGCKASMPTIEKIASELHGQVLVVGANIDNAPKATEEYNVASIPTIVFFKDGKEIHRTDGTVPYRKLIAEFQSRFGL